MCKMHIGLMNSIQALYASADETWSVTERCCWVGDGGKRWCVLEMRIKVGDAGKFQGDGLVN